MSTNTITMCNMSESLMSSKEFSKLCTQTDLFYKKLDNFKDLVQCRGDVFSQKKENYKNLKEFQFSKMQKEKELYLKKIEELSRKIEESKTQLLGLEGTISDLRKKHSYQSQVNEELKEQFETLQLSIKEKNENFTKTLDNYTTVINYYENYLNMSLDLDKDNHNIVTIKFTNLQSDSQVQIEAIDNATFKILKAHPLLNDEKITERIISKPELMLLLYNTQKQVKGCST